MPRCLNCNRRLSGKDKFCPECGQPASTSRYTMSTAFTQGLASVMRFDSGLPHTLRQLFFCPWVVIRDMIQGRRASYTPAVKLLVILSFVYIIIGELLGSKVQGTFSGEADEGVEEVGSLLVATVRMIDGSVITQYLLLTIPATIISGMVFRGMLKARYNTAEYFTATCYFACLFMALNILALPLRNLSGQVVAEAVGTFIFVYLSIMIFLSIRRAFGLSFWRTVRVFLVLVSSVAVGGMVMVIAFVGGLLMISMRISGN